MSQTLSPVVEWKLSDGPWDPLETLLFRRDYNQDTFLHIKPFLEPDTGPLPRGDSNHYC